MDKNKIKELGAAWKALDERYDTYIQGLIDMPEPVAVLPEKLKELKEMQGELFGLEVELFKALQGE